MPNRSDRNARRVSPTLRPKVKISSDKKDERLIDGLTIDDYAHRYGLLCALFEAAWHHDVPASLDELEAGPMFTSSEARRLSMLTLEVFDRFEP